MSRSLRLFCKHCFTHHGFEKLFIRTHESNVPARKLAAGSEFEIEGTLRWDDKTSTGELVDVLYYGKIWQS